MDITGSVIGSDGLFVTNPYLAPLVTILIIIAIVMHYRKKRAFSGKKE